MNRTTTGTTSTAGASRSSGSINASSTLPSSNTSQQFGGGPLLRTKHIDTLEVLESQTREFDRLQKENRSMMEKLSKLMAGQQPDGTAGNIDLNSRITTLETQLSLTQSSNSELLSRIALLTTNKQRHAQNEEENLRIKYEQMVKKAEEKEEEWKRRYEEMVQKTTEEINNLKKERSDLFEKLTKQQEEHRLNLATISSLQEQITSLQSLLNNATTSASATSSSLIESYKAKLQKVTSSLQERDSQLTHSRIELQSEKKRGDEIAEEKKKLIEIVQKCKDEIQQLQKDLTKATSSASKSSQSPILVIKQRASAPAPLVSTSSSASAQHSASTIEAYKKLKEEGAKKEQMWKEEKVGMEEMIGMLKKSLDEAQQSQPSSSSSPDMTTLQQQHSATLKQLRHDLETRTEQYSYLQHEHTKLVKAYNHLLATGGGGGAGGDGTTNNTVIMNSSKKNNFPEYLKMKRENDTLQQQVNELQQLIYVLQQNKQQGLSNIQQLQRVGSKTINSSHPSSTSSTPPSSTPSSSLSGSSTPTKTTSMPLISSSSNNMNGTRNSKVSSSPSSSALITRVKR